jgi:hypothetical protein
MSSYDFGEVLVKNWYYNSIWGQVAKCGPNHTLPSKTGIYRELYLYYTIYKAVGL